MTKHADIARGLLGSVQGMEISEAQVIVAAAQVHATLYVGEQLERLANAHGSRP